MARATESPPGVGRAWVRTLAGGIAVALFVAASWAWGLASADAHALLRASNPGEGASVESPPAEVLLAFTEDPDPGLTVVTVTGADGRPVGAGAAVAVEDQPKQVRVPLEPLGDGTYTVTWRVTSPTDGHTTVGTFSFSVGPPPDAPTPGVTDDGPASPASTASTVPTVAEVIGRWLFSVGAVVMLGAAAVGLFVASTPTVIGRRALVGAWVVAAVGLALSLTDQRAGADTSWSAFLATSTGAHLAAQAATLALVAAAIVGFWRKSSRPALALVGVAVASAMAAKALAGHANTSSVRALTLSWQWVHLMAVGVWVGGLAWLLVAMRQRDPGRGRGLAARFSTIAGISLVVVAVTGTLRAVDEVGAWSRLLTTNYGLTLLAKLALFGGLVSLGWRSRQRGVPNAMDGRPEGLRRSVRAEVAVAAGILGATAVLAGFPPSATVASAARLEATPTVSVRGSDERLTTRVRLTMTPGTVGSNAFDVVVEDHGSGERLDPHGVTLQILLPERLDLPPSVLRLAGGDDGHWRATSAVISTAGLWSVTAVVATDGGPVEVPMEADIAGDFSDGPAPGSCLGGRLDDRYSITIDSDPDPPKAEETTFTLRILRGGAPVTGAEVCLRVDMPSMQHPGVLTLGQELSPGRYRAVLKFSMTGIWSGSVVVGEPGANTVVLPVQFEIN